MARNPYDKLSRRERQIMDILLELGEASAEEVRSRLPDPPSYSAARAMLGKLESKGHVRHGERDLRYVWRPAISRSAAQSSAVSRLINVFFGGSVTRAVTGMLDASAQGLSTDELDEMAEAIEKARGKRSRNDKRGRGR